MMMKKNILALFAVAALTASSFVHAEAIDPTTAISTEDCAVLGEAVRLNLSSGVSGAYECSEARNAINVGACHATGSRSTSLTCAQIGLDEAGDPTYNNEDCDGTAGQVVTLESPSYRGFRASTTGGSVGAQSLSANCDSGTVEELVPFL
jgi:hypothetical protein